MPGVQAVLPPAPLPPPAPSHMLVVAIMPPMVTHAVEHDAPRHEAVAMDTAEGLPQLSIDVQVAAGMPS